MASVQAQYPSNVLLLNTNPQDSIDYSSSHSHFHHQQQQQQQQHPAASGFLHLSDHMSSFNNININSTPAQINPRKRAREEVIGGIPINNTYMNMMQQQQQQPNLIHLSQLHNHQSQHNIVSTGLRLSFDDQQLQQNHNYQHPHNFVSQSSSPVLPIPSSSSSVSADFAMQIKRQRDEIDQFLQLQGEQLRRTLAEKRQRHYCALLGVAEESITRRLRDKEVEVEKATRRNAELEARATQLRVESQVWQAKARAQEAAAVSLQAQLQQAIINGGGGGGGDSKIEGLDCSGGGVEVQAEDAESMYIDPDRVTESVSGGPRCKGCRKGMAGVVILPCRHLCLCTECDKVIDACPVCLTMRKSSVQVFLS